jgi:hypothetical protein
LFVLLTFFVYVFPCFGWNFSAIAPVAYIPLSMECQCYCGAAAAAADRGIYAAAAERGIYATGAIALKFHPKHGKT